MSAEKNTIIILHVENDPDSHDLISRKLNDLSDGLEFIWKTSAEEALTFLSDNHVDCVVCEENLPGRNGHEILRELRNAGNTIPFIILTIESSEAIVKKAFRLGASDCFGKNEWGANYRRLLNSITKAVKAHRTELEKNEMISALQISDERLRRFAKASFEPIFVHRNGVVLDCNQACADLLETSREALIGRTVLEYVLPSWKDSAREQLGVEEESLFDIVIQKKDGSSFPAEVHGRAIDWYGEKARIVALRDISRQEKTSEMLMRSAHHFKNIVRNSQLIGISLDKHGKLIYVNEYFIKLTGLSEEKLLGMDWFEQFTSADNREEIRKLFFHALREDAALTNKNAANNYIVLPGGQKRMISWTYVRDTDLEGMVTGLSCIGTDLTDHKLLEDKLRDNESRLEVALENGRIGLWDWNMSSDAITINEEWACICGYSREELGPLTFEKFESLCHPDDFKLMMEHFYEYLAGSVENYDIELRMQHKDGHWVWIITRGRIVERDTNGSPLRMIGTHIDISERKNTLLKLAEREELFYTITSSANDAIVMMDGDGRVTYWNTAAENIFGYSEDEIQGRHLSNFLVSPENVDQFENVVSQYLNKGNVGDYGKTSQLTALRKDGVEIEIEISISSVTAKDTVHSLAILRDISERKQYENRLLLSRNRARRMSEELATANKELEMFTYAVSHDLKAPLRHISGFANVLIDTYGESLEQKAQSLVGLITESVQNMKRLVDDMLRLSRVQRQELSCTRVNLSELAAEIVERLLQNEPERNVEFTIQPELKDTADIGLLKIALENVLNNAWKYTVTSDPARISFGTVVVADIGETVYYISDNGTGFDPANAEKIFMPFTRLHSDEKYRGTGIGLSTVKRIMDRHVGRIWAESEPGSGTTVYFTLGASQRKRIAMEGRTNTVSM